MVWEFQDAADAFIAFRDGTGRTAALLAGQTSEQLKAIEEHITRGTEAKRTGPEGICRFQMPCVLTMAKKALV